MNQDLSSDNQSPIMPYRLDDSHNFFVTWVVFGVPISGLGLHLSALRINL